MNEMVTSLNERAVLISFGNVIDRAINEKVITLHQRFLKNPFPGFVESSPAYSSLAIFYDPEVIWKVKGNARSVFEWVRSQVESTLESPEPTATAGTAVVDVPVLYDGEDLNFVAEYHHISREEAVALHVAEQYRVFLLGFLPGFAYMGTLGEKIATPRRSTPRTHVPAGSVGIAGFQTGIYPLQSPGGWQLIGRTPIKIFDKQKASPCLFAPGDHVRFYPIDEQEFNARNEY
jgi:inhibitor of KinA